MIKFIISGTSDGWKRQYVSDGDIYDPAFNALRDCRSIFNYKELKSTGYSFQTVNNDGIQGIIYQKNVLLLDSHSRNGFMTISLFLPKDELLDGRDIKDALDSVTNDYIRRTNDGIATDGIDWSFVKSKADELNTKVRTATWRKIPTPTSPDKTTALIKNAENRIADFFQYPNPLHRVCAGFQQVFLTESILNHSLTPCPYQTLEIDIDNIEYNIEYTNPQPGAKINVNRTTITQSELNVPGEILLGSYTKPGYRPANIAIKQSEKKSPDGVSIVVVLPTLTQMRATVEFNICDAKSGKNISSSNWSVLWTKSDSPFDRPVYISHNGGTFTFLGEQCNSRWHFSIKCDAYETYSGDINITDGHNEKTNILLTPKPLWAVKAKYPNGEKTINSSVVADDIDDQIEAAKNFLIRNGLDVERIDKNNDTFIVYVIGKKKESGLNPNPNGGTTPNNTTEPDTPKKHKHFLQLDDKSRNYSLFKNYQRDLAQGNIDAYAIRSPKNAVYDPKKHRIFLTSNSEFCNSNVVLYDTRRYSYRLTSCKWNREGTLQPVVSSVKRSLKPGPKIFAGVATSLVLLCTFACLIFGRHHNDDFTPFKMEIQALLTTVNDSSFFADNRYSRYCGHSYFDSLDLAKKKAVSFKKDHPKYDKDEIFHILDSVYDNQKERKSVELYGSYKSRIINNSLEIDIIKETINKDSVLSLDHLRELNSLCDSVKKIQEKECAEQSKYENLLSKALSKNGSVDDCIAFLDYNNVQTADDLSKIAPEKEKSINDVGRKLAQIGLSPNHDKETCKKAKAKYLAIWPNGSSAKKLKGENKTLTNNSNTAGKAQQKPTELKIATEIFKKLTWENVKDNGNVFNSEYTISDYNNQEKVKKIIENAKKVGEQDYKKAYEDATKDNGKTNKIDALLNKIDALLKERNKKTSN